MAADRRRVTGPEIAQPLVFDLPPGATLAASLLLPKFFVNTGTVSNSNGSCYLERGNTTIVVSVYGAKPIRSNSLNSSASFTVSAKISPSVQCGEENEASVTTNSISKTQFTKVENRLAGYIQSTFLPSIMLSKYPKSTIEVFVNVLTSDDVGLMSLVTWSSNCAALALVDSGIELKDIVSTGNCRVVDGKIVADSPGSGPGVLVSCMSTSNKIVGLMTEGDFAELQLEELIKEGQDIASEVRLNFNGYLMAKVEG